MSIFHSMNTTASALTAQRLRMDVVSSNMANADTTRAKLVNGEWEPYRRKISCDGTKGKSIFNFICKRQWTTGTQGTGNGVKVTKIARR